jgi:hypothetical protein
LLFWRRKGETQQQIGLPLSEKEMNGQLVEEADDKKSVQAANSSMERSESMSHQEAHVPQGRESSSTNPSQAKPASHPHLRRASGLRTSQGKQRSKYNAIKHGIFAAVVLPKGESRVQYESLLKDLFENLAPQGRLEETLVEKLAMLSWRHKRLIEAEIAEIQDATEFLESEQQNRKLPSLEELHTLEKFGPSQLIDHKDNPEILQRCLSLLLALKVTLLIRGFTKGLDIDILTTIYGINRPTRTLLESYRVWYETSQVSEEERKRMGYATPAVCKQRVLEGIDDEITRLMEYQEMQETVNSQRIALARIRLRVPHSPVLDRLLRYEASIERSFDRTLNQLERLQRMRLGQPASPTVQLNVLP